MPLMPPHLYDLTQDPLFAGLNTVRLSHSHFRPAALSAAGAKMTVLLCVRKGSCKVEMCYGNERRCVVHGIVQRLLVCTQLLFAPCILPDCNMACTDSRIRR